VEGDRRVSLSKIMSVFSWSARAVSSLSLCIIPLEFQNKIFKLFIGRRENCQECFYGRFYHCFGVLVGCQGSQ